MTRRRDALVGLGLISTMRIVRTNPDKVWRIGYVTAIDDRLALLRTSLATLGYFDGQNIRIVFRKTQPQSEAAAEAIKSILSEIDVLVVSGTFFAVIAKKIAPTIPTVFMNVGNPVRLGLVATLAKPGGNQTGITFEAADETYGKRLQLLKELVPSLRKVGLLCAPEDPNRIPATESIERAAPGLAVRLTVHEVGSVDGFGEAFSAMKKEGVEGILVVAGVFMYLHGRLIAEMSVANRLPSAHAFRETVIAGGLIGLGPDIDWMVPQVAGQVAKILRGAKASDIPVEQPSRYEVFLNLKTARTLGIQVPRSVLMRADEVIQ